MAVFSGDVVFSCVIGFVYSRIFTCNDSGHMKRCLGTFVAKLHD